MTWNLLARALCEPDELNRAPKETFDWPLFRKWRTLEELLRFDCDILCVEEADIYEDIKPYLHSIGYTSIFCPKFSSPCLAAANNYGPDGCAIFYRKSMFQIQNMSCEKIFTNNTDDASGSSKSINSQIFIIMQLKHLPSGNHLTIVSVHLKSKEENEAKRWQQIEYILGVVKEHVKASTRWTDIKTHPVILCGDFNGEPFERFYKSIIQMNELKLRDAYSLRPVQLLDNAGRIIEVEAVAPKQPTTVKIRRSHGGMLKRAIDYVFFTVDGLELIEILELPLDDTLMREQGLPNLTYSSDHLSLACGFRFMN